MTSNSRAGESGVVLPTSTTESYRVLMWLGYWRDHLPSEAVAQLQDLCTTRRTVCQATGCGKPVTHIVTAPDGDQYSACERHATEVTVGLNPWRIETVDALK